MTDLYKRRNIRLINNTIAHEVGHLIASLMLNEIQEEPTAEQIKIIWIEYLQRPGGQIDYSRKEGPNYWKFPNDLNLCYYTIFSLYSGCIWEKFFDSIYHQKELNIEDIELCFEFSGSSDMQTIGIINSKHIKRVLTKPLTREKIILPYINFLKGFDINFKLKIYNYLELIAIKIESHFNETGILEYIIANEEFNELKKIMKTEIIKKHKDDLIQIILNIKEIIKLE